MWTTRSRRRRNGVSFRLGFVLGLVVWSSGCVDPAGVETDAYPRKWSVVLDEGVFLAYRAPAETEFGKVPPGQKRLPFPEGVAWMSMSRFEEYADTLFRKPGTFVYVIRVGSNEDELFATVKVLGKAGIFAMSQEQSLKEIAEEGRYAKWFLESLPAHPASQ